MLRASGRSKPAWNLVRSVLLNCYKLTRNQVKLALTASTKLMSYANIRLGALFIEALEGKGKISNEMPTRYNLLYETCQGSLRRGSYTLVRSRPLGCAAVL